MTDNKHEHGPGCNHDHGHSHDHEHSHGHNENKPHEHSHQLAGTEHLHPKGCPCQQYTGGAPLSDEEILEIENDPAAGSLSRALKGSFFFLKIGMAVLALFFILDRFRSVNEGEVMLIKRFGAFITDQNGIKVFKPGQYHFIWPYPVEQAVVIRTSEEKELDLDANFWPRTTAEVAVDSGKVLAEVEQLAPDLDGYNITGDLNVLHTRWKVKYRISSFRNYILTSEKPLEIFKSICQSSVVENFAGVSVDQAYYGDRQSLFDIITEQVNIDLAKAKIGIELVSLINTTLLPPGKTQPAFDKLTSSLSERKKLIDKARTDANKLVKEGETDALSVRNDAQQYKVATTSRAKADADRLNDLLAKFPNDPQGLQIFLEQYRYDRLKQALANSNIYIMREGNNIFWTSPGPADFMEEKGNNK